MSLITDKTGQLNNNNLICNAHLNKYVHNSSYTSFIKRKRKSSSKNIYVKHECHEYYNDIPVFNISKRRTIFN